MGAIVRTYREWKLSGDTAWMRSLWPAVKKALAYAWHPDNEHGWDRDRDGVLEGAQHHTLDVELYGPSAYLNGYYQAALLAASRMGEAVGDEDAAEYARLYAQGREWIDRHAFNGEYYRQLLDLADDRYPIDPELGQIKYQIGEGCHIDQVIGQWHASIAGLGDIFDPGQVRRALASIYRHNFASMRGHANANRVYALNDERGLLVCTWPNGGRPLVPVP
ncbi:GH116 family glycosyl hydrolase [Cohnella rhizosphaerae]|uniref:Glycoside hydrolase family 116 protein n=1 Tax=Cohnella rhizosphaerae TaxID=1457232 RepID=A0A9X4KZU6_9BACL|nr:GH116 family glycosyl hydrolase [Cohnella rhizosphaerae]MDG0814339.1 glycoside hydrolase family 116 protein [Cohnella rhizosphaerae]